MAVSYALPAGWTLTEEDLNSEFVDGRWRVVASIFRSAGSPARRQWTIPALPNSYPLTATVRHYPSLATSLDILWTNVRIVPDYAEYDPLVVEHRLPVEYVAVAADLGRRAGNAANWTTVHARSRAGGARARLEFPAPPGLVALIDGARCLITPTGRCVIRVPYGRPGESGRPQ